MCKENKVPALLFAQNNYIEKEIFSTSVFPKGIDSSPSIHEDALKVVKEYLWTASDGWIAVYDTNEHRYDSILQFVVALELYQNSVGIELMMIFLKQCGRQNETSGQLRCHQYGLFQ